MGALEKTGPIGVTLMGGSGTPLAIFTYQIAAEQARLTDADAVKEALEDLTVPEDSNMLYQLSSRPYTSKNRSVQAGPEAFVIVPAGPVVNGVITSL